MSHSNVDKTTSGASWESFIRSFQQYAQSRQVNPQVLDDVVGEAHVRIAKMIKSGRMPPKGPKAVFDLAYKAVMENRKREQDRLSLISEASSSRRNRASKRVHEHRDPRLVARTLLLGGFSKEDEAILKTTCPSDGRSKCPEGLDRPSSREHAKKLGVSYETVRRLAKRFKKALDDQLLIEKFISLEKLEPPSKLPWQWSELLEKGIFLGKIAMILDAAACADKHRIGYAIAKHLPDLCNIYKSLVMRSERLENPEEFKVLLSVKELLFLACRYAPRQSKDDILKMCEDLGKHQQSKPFFFERLLRLLPAYCACEDEEKHWQGLWRFYEMDENDKRFSLDALHLHAYNQPGHALWHRSKDILLERSNKTPEYAYRIPGDGIKYTLHALKKAATAYKQNPSLERMSLYWAWECFRLLPLERKPWSDLYAGVEELTCYQENEKLKHMLLNRFRRSS